MNNKVIEIQNLSKKYTLFHRRENGATFVDTLANAGKRLFQRLSSVNGKEPSYEEFWALKDLSFDVYEGDRVGIIGKNGAGKSTLLKILSRITEPTKGIVKIKGRLSSLLEVGTGFHQELTGRENIFLSGAILGMKRAEIKKKFDEIVAFSEVEKFLDTPVKRYSSGMYMRLGFAIAAHLESDILIIDEVLAVGDLQFQAKCHSKINELSQKGRTVLFVSHNMGSVASLCNRGLAIEKGRVVQSGSLDECIEKYMQMYQGCGLSWEGCVGDEHIRITSAYLKSSKDFFYHEDKPKLCIEYEILKPDPELYLSIGVWNMRHQLLAGSNSYDDAKIQKKFVSIGKQRIAVPIDAGLFHEGEYLVKLRCAIHNKKQITDEEIVLKFPVFAKSKSTRFKTGLEQEGVLLGNSWE